VQQPQKPLDVGVGENSYFIYGAENNGIEMARLINQTQLIHNMQGEIFPVQFDLTRVLRVLDVACGPGGWSIEVARAYSHIDVVGFDISPSMIEHAQMFAEAEGVENVEFQVMDATRPLAFDDESFDLVNASYLQSFMTPDTWVTFLLECLRILRPGGILKITELEFGVTSSPAAEALYETWAKTMKEAGRSFSCDGRHLGASVALVQLLRKTGYIAVEFKPYVWESSYGTPGHQGFQEDLLTLIRHLLPFIRKVKGEEAFEQTRLMLQQALVEIQSESFSGLVFMLTCWGSKPTRTSPTVGKRSEW